MEGMVKKKNEFYFSNQSCINVVVVDDMIIIVAPLGGRICRTRLILSPLSRPVAAAGRVRLCSASSSSKGKRSIICGIFPFIII